MTEAKSLVPLKALAQLALDHRLGQMRAASLALARSRDQMAALNEREAPADLPLVPGARAELTYQRWADQRRSELNLVIARQTAEWLQEQDAARQAFGRVQALQALTEKLAMQRR